MEKQTLQKHTLEKQSWKNIQAQIRQRIAAREWEPGDLIPGESQLAQQLGCARATVNRALQGLADAGLIERRRKAGTRVKLYPVRKATLEIPITRLEVEQSGATYRHQIKKKKIVKTPPSLAKHLNLSAAENLLHLSSVHYANQKPFLYEERYICIATVPAIANIDFEQVSANEWLVRNAPFTHGDVAISAENASSLEAEQLQTREGAAIVVIDRTTWNQAKLITNVRLAYAPGYRMYSAI